MFTRLRKLFFLISANLKQYGKQSFSTFIQIIQIYQNNGAITTMVKAGLKVTKKTKIIFWLAVVANAFRITFYFSEKVVQSFSKLSISKTFDKKIKESKKVGKSTALTFLMNDKTNLELVIEAIELKIKTK